MKNQKLYLTLGAVGVLLVAVVAVVALQGKGGNLSGDLGRVTNNVPINQPPINLNYVTVTLSPTSPSGSKYTNPDLDSVATYTLCAKGDTEIGKIDFTFASDASLNPGAFSATANRVFAVKTIKGIDYGSYKVGSSSSSIVSLNYTMASPLKLFAGTCQNVDVLLVSGSVIVDQVAVNDMLTTQLIKLYRANGTIMPSTAPTNSYTLRY